MKNSVQFKRRLNHFLTYLYMVVLSIVIIYPLLITIYRYLDLMDLQVDNQFFSSIFNGRSGNLDYLCDCCLLYTSDAADEL